MDDRKLLIQAYDKIIKEERLKREKHQMAQERLEKEARERRLGKINVDPSILKQLDVEIAAGKTATNAKMLLKATVEKQASADIFNQNVQEQRLKPITKPLQALVDAVKLSPALNAKTESLKTIEPAPLKGIEADPLWSEKEKEEMGETAEKYLNFWIKNKKTRDEAYGIRADVSKGSGHFYIGNHHLAVSNNNISLDNGKTWFEGTNGLWELITHSKPNPVNFTDLDLLNYKEILRVTNVHKINYDSKAHVKGNSGYKYSQIIRPLIEKDQPTLADELAKVTGKGLTHRVWKLAHNFPVEYRYYHTRKELKHRLKVLLGEIAAGNNGPHMCNQVIDILKKLNIQKARGITNRLYARDGLHSGDGLIDDGINNTPIEFHWPGFEYLGPGTNNYLKQEKGIKPANKLDELAMDHDNFYSENKDIEKRHKADYVLQEGAWKRFLAPDASLGEKIPAWVTTSAMKLKRFLGAGFSRSFLL